MGIGIGSAGFLFELAESEDDPDAVAEAESELASLTKDLGDAARFAVSLVIWACSARMSAPIWVGRSMTRRSISSTQRVSSWMCRCSSTPRRAGSTPLGAMIV